MPRRNATLRFWFRDARLSELPIPTPPLTLRPTSSSQSEAGPSRYRFPYPCTFLPVPYASDTSLPFMLSQVIPAARSIRTIDLVVPQPASSSPFGLPSVPFAPSITTEVTMQVETGSVLPTPLPTPAPLPAQTYVPAQGRAQVKPDGLLLYVREASYEPGTSPLSNWVPVELESPVDEASMGAERLTPNAGGSTRPLDLFEWQVR
jgi:snurportin-1